MTHGVPADFSAQVRTAERLAKARRLELYGVSLVGGQVRGICRTPERRPREVEQEAQPSSRGVQAMLI